MTTDAGLCQVFRSAPSAATLRQTPLPAPCVALSVLCRLPGEPSCRASFCPQRNRPCPERLRDRGEVIARLGRWRPDGSGKPGRCGRRRRSGGLCIGSCPWEETSACGDDEGRGRAYRLPEGRASRLSNRLDTGFKEAFPLGDHVAPSLRRGGHPRRLRRCGTQTPPIQFATASQRLPHVRGVSVMNCVPLGLCAPVSSPQPATAASPASRTARTDAPPARGRSQTVPADSIGPQPDPARRAP